MAANSPHVTPDRIRQLSSGYAPPLIIEAAIHHNVFDILDATPSTVEQVSAQNGASVRGLRILMNALVPLQLLTRSDDGVYSLTPESAAFLVSSRQPYIGGLLRHASGQLIPNWLHLTEVVRTGNPVAAVNQEEAGSEFFQQFVEAIFPNSYLGAQALADALGIAKAESVVKVLDVATGSGVWGIALAEKSVQVHVTAVDWPDVLTVTRRVAGRHGVLDRFQFVEGDLLTVEFGTGYNVVTLGQILHSEGEERSQTLLTRVYEALAPGGIVAIAEMVPDDDRRGPAHALIFAVNMLINTEHGDTYTFAEISEWLTQAGFVDPRLLPAPGPSPLILATKPG